MPKNFETYYSTVLSLARYISIWHVFNTFIFNVGPASYGNRFLFSYFNQPSLSSLVSISLVLTPLRLLQAATMPPISPRATTCRSCLELLSLSLYLSLFLVVVAVFLMVVGCFDCWWLANFGWWWWVDQVVGVRFGMGLRFGMGSDVLFLWLWMGLTSAAADMGFFFFSFFFFFIFLFFWCKGCWWSVVDFVGLVGGCGLWRLICGCG